MRHQRLQRMAMPAPTPCTNGQTGHQGPNYSSGYALIVDGQIKSEFNTRNAALKAGRDLEGRFQRLQVKIYDAENKLSQTIELVAPRPGWQATRLFEACAYAETKTRQKSRARENRWRTSGQPLSLANYPPFMIK
jgi:hypothetical protein